MAQQLTDVWKLETPSQDVASDDLNGMIDFVYNTKYNFGYRMSNIGYLRHLWNDESWKSIKSKLETEGSAWYVWWMDGVNHHLCHLMEIEHPGFDN